MKGSGAKVPQFSEGTQPTPVSSLAGVLTLCGYYGPGDPGYTDFSSLERVPWVTTGPLFDADTLCVVVGRGG